MVISYKQRYKIIGRIFFTSKISLSFVLSLDLQLSKTSWHESCVEISHFLLKMNISINAFFLYLIICSSKKISTIFDSFSLLVLDLR